MSDNIIPPEIWNNFWRRQAVLMRRPRVRRTAEPPEDRRGSGDKEPAYPHMLAGVLPGYEVAYRRGGWRKLYTIQPDEPGAEPAHVRLRDTFAWISQGGRRVGAVGLQEIEAFWVDPQAFGIAMDDESDRLCHLAEVLLSEWQDVDHEIFAYGPVLELREVWVEPRHSRPGIWKPVAHALIDRVLRNCALLICHCFPLEYSCLVPDDAQTRPAFERRRKAMMRAAAREFGLAPLPGAPGKEGYVWRPRPGLEEHIAEPQYDESWGDFDF